MKWIKVHHKNCELVTNEACEDCSDQKTQLLNGLTIEREHGQPNYIAKPYTFEKKGSMFYIKSLWGGNDIIDFNKVVNFNGSLQAFTDYLAACACSATTATELDPPLRIEFCCPAATIVEYWDGTTTTATLPAPPDGCTILPSSIQVSANGAEQAPGATSFGFTTTVNTDGSVDVTTSNDWGSVDDPCTMIFNYSLECVNV